MGPNMHQCFSIFVFRMSRTPIAAAIAFCLVEDQSRAENHGFLHQETPHAGRL